MKKLKTSFVSHNSSKPLHVDFLIQFQLFTYLSNFLKRSHKFTKFNVQPHQTTENLSKFKQLFCISETIFIEILILCQMVVSNTTLHCNYTFKKHESFC